MPAMGQALVMTQTRTQLHRIRTPLGQLFAQTWAPPVEQGPPIVLLHDSLGCVALWRDFPERLVQATGRRVIAYDRLGFGQSDAHPGTLAVSFVQDEASEGFAAILQHFGLSQFVALGHSVGGGMAVCCAVAYPDACVGLVTESAQAFVEEGTLEGIRAAQQQFAQPEQRARLKRYHGDKAEWVLHAWIDTWLSPAFSQWRLDEQLLRVRCPVLCLHGVHDEYGSIHQPQHLAALVSGPATVRLLPDCGHVPHREQAGEVLAALGAFLLPHQAAS